MKRIVFFFIFFLNLVPNLFSQEHATVYSPHQLGLHAGLCTGAGLSYRYWPGKLGVQFTCTPVKTEEGWSDLLDIKEIAMEIADVNLYDKRFISVGISALLQIGESDHFKLFTYWGNHYLLRNEKKDLNTGIGLGFAIDAPVSFNLMVGYGAYDILDDYSLFPTIELGFYYRFRKH